MITNVRPSRLPMNAASRLMTLASVLLSGLLLCLPASADPFAGHKLHWNDRSEQIEWQIFQKEKQANRWTMEMVPAGSEENDLSNLLVVQAFVKPEPFDLVKWSTALMYGYQESCNQVRIDKLKNRDVIGYEQQSFMIMCGQKLQEDFGVYSFIKAMRKDEMLYVVLREIRVPPSDTPGVLTVPNNGELSALKSAPIKAVQYIANDVFLCGPDIINEACQ